ncbi:uncharacterized protein RCO7_02638 [Rhynchosporium graminicola]|uniref:YDG domain-containing protein n=1 Tax=Rhynchosporium graminicola TaxID=2792576 RepID=A0A1E1KJ85_9HELO|nr:uncharacterized protein RCO7_02638 [Rhynchosporium commune]
MEEINTNLNNADTPSASLSLPDISPPSTIDALFEAWLGSIDPEILILPALSPSESLCHLIVPAKIGGARSKGQRRLSDNHIMSHKILLWRASRIEVYDPELEKKIKLKTILEMFTIPSNNFGGHILEIATVLKERFEKQNWGVVVPAPVTNAASGTGQSKSPRSESDNDLEFDTDDFESANKGSASNPKPKSTSVHRYKITDADLSSIPRSANRIKTTCIWALAPSYHPLFGLNGCMHHIAMCDSSNYYISGGRVNAAVFGHNGLEMGQCWARRIDAMRDGVHGVTQAGIFGTAMKGVYSLVLSAPYSGLDEDTGEKIYYSVSGAVKATSSEPKLDAPTTRALLKSIDTGTGIRVLRHGKHKGSWKGCPVEGLRYDGLYQAVGWATKMNQLGGKFAQVGLVRMSGQADIREDKPNREDLLQLEKMKDGY